MHSLYGGLLKPLEALGALQSQLCKWLGEGPANGTLCEASPGPEVITHLGVYKAPQ